MNACVEERSRHTWKARPVSLPPLPLDRRVGNVSPEASVTPPPLTWDSPHNGQPASRGRWSRRQTSVEPAQGYDYLFAPGYLCLGLETSMAALLLGFLISNHEQSCTRIMLQGLPA